MNAHPHLERRLIPIAVLPVGSGGIAKEFAGIDIDPADIHVVRYDYSAKFLDNGMTQSDLTRSQSNSLKLLLDLEKVLNDRVSGGNGNSNFDPERSNVLNELALRMTEAIVSLALLRRSREISAWDDLIRLADDAPQNVAQSAEVRQLLALALNRRDDFGDQDRAIAIMEQLISETGGNAESFGVLGRIYKDSFVAARSRNDPGSAGGYLNRALYCYRTGFAMNPKDIYTGFNVVSLLLQSENDRTELDEFLPRIRAAVNENINSSRNDPRGLKQNDPRVLAMKIQLAAMAGDWSEAEGTTHEFLSTSVPTWLAESLIRDLRDLGTRLPLSAQDHLRTLQALLAAASGEASDAG